jgi:transcriptional regulator with XRE-family HTH domain
LTYLRAVRLLHGTSLDALASAIGAQKSTISTAERYPDTAGPRLRKKLSRHFGIPWATLQRTGEGNKLAAAIINELAGQQ